MSACNREPHEDELWPDGLPYLTLGLNPLTQVVKVTALSLTLQEAEAARSRAAEGDRDACFIVLRFSDHMGKELFEWLRSMRVPPDQANHLIRRLSRKLQDGMTLGYFP